MGSRKSFANPLSGLQLSQDIENRSREHKVAKGGGGRHNNPQLTGVEDGECNSQGCSEAEKKKRLAENPCKGFEWLVVLSVFSQRNCYPEDAQDYEECNCNVVPEIQYVHRTACTVLGRCPKKLFLTPVGLAHEDSLLEDFNDFTVARAVSHGGYEVYQVVVPQQAGLEHSVGGHP